MVSDDLVVSYNYDTFVPDKIESWMRFHESPSIGDDAPDFPLQDLEGKETRLSEWWGRHAWLIVEFGSFT